MGRLSGWIDNAKRRGALFLTAPIACLPCAAAAYEADLSSRVASQSLFFEEYLPADAIEMGWTGEHATCDAGETSAEYRAAVLDRINYFRAMAGVPAEIVLDESFNGKAQQAALMMSVNANASHTPPTNWTCYSADAAAAARNSNLAVYRSGPDAIDAYVRDAGTGNEAVGHRRLILAPRTTRMGVGDVPVVAPFPTANALWVLDAASQLPTRPATREPYVAWPPPGYVPYQIVFARWSFSYPQADFDNAVVRMLLNQTPVPVTAEPVIDGFGDNTLAWKPTGMNTTLPWPRPDADAVYQVLIENVRLHGITRDFAYEVTIFDPFASDRLQADLNGDAMVDGDDLQLWQSAFGESKLGDVDGDADTDGADFIMWQRFAGAGGGDAVPTLRVPEPAVVWLALLAPATTLLRRTRRRRAPRRASAAAPHSGNLEARCI
jgi:uncharacterized protein YkwD